MYLIIYIYILLPYLLYTKKMEVVVDSCVRDYHMYQEIWTPVSGEYLNCK